MTDEKKPEEEIKVEVDFGETAVQVGLEQVMKIHEIERMMLTRAIQVITGLTKIAPEEVVTKLSEGLNEEYDNAVATAQAATNVAKLYVPPKRTLDL